MGSGSGQPGSSGSTTDNHPQHTPSPGDENRGRGRKVKTTEVSSCHKAISFEWWLATTTTRLRERCDVERSDQSIAKPLVSIIIIAT